MSVETKIEFSRLNTRLNDWIDHFKTKNDREPSIEEINRLPRIKNLFDRYNELKKINTFVPIASPRTCKLKSKILSFASPSPKKRRNTGDCKIIEESPRFKINLLPKSLFRKVAKIIPPSPSNENITNAKNTFTATKTKIIRKSPLKAKVRQKLMTPVFSSPLKLCLLTSKRKKTQLFSPESSRLLLKTSEQTGIEGSMLKKLDFSSFIPKENEGLAILETKTKPKKRKKPQKKPKLRKENCVSENFVRTNLRHNSWRDKRNRKKFKRSGFHTSINKE